MYYSLLFLLLLLLLFLLLLLLLCIGSILRVRETRYCAHTDPLKNRVEQ
jgi:hypothetical protein